MTGSPGIIQLRQPRQAACAFVCVVVCIQCMLVCVSVCLLDGEYVVIVHADDGFCSSLPVHW